MIQQNVQLFLMKNQKYFDPSQLPIVTEKINQLDDNQVMILSAAGYKDPTIMLIISLFLGTLGIDRFLLGDITAGVLKLISLGGLGIWTIIDWFLIQQKTKQSNFELFLDSINVQSHTNVPVFNNRNDDEKNVIEQLKKYKELLDSGIISQEEFDEKKKSLLNK